MGRFDALTTLETKPIPTPPLPEKPAVIKPVNPPADQLASKLANQQTSKEVKKQTTIPANQFASKEVNQQISKETNQQTSKLANQQTTKEKKKYGTYLREDSISAIQILAVQTKQKDHVVLQEMVDFYFTKKK
jgi:hypothetical protein